MSAFAVSDDYCLLDLPVRLRPDLKITPAADGELDRYLIEDARHGTFFQVGAKEFALLAQLDGSQTPRQIWQVIGSQRPELAMTQTAVVALIRWLLAQELIEDPQQTHSWHGPRHRPAGDRDRTGWPWNPFFLRIHLFQPQPWIDRLESWLGWLFSPVAAAIAVVLSLVTAAELLASWSEMVASLHGIVSPAGSLKLLTCWLMLKVIHELGHGVACRRYGGYVRSAGVVFILLAPVAYTDVTSSWRFRRKAHRIATALGGMYFELLVAMLAAWAWLAWDQPVARQWCANCLLMATATTILFNANPLMRFDGYYVLSDVLGIPNLYSLGIQYVNYLSERYLWGEPAKLPPWPSRRGIIVRTYAIASLIWRFMIIGGLVLAAAYLFRGLGILLSALGLVIWLVAPTWRVIRRFAEGHQGRPPRRWRFLFASGGLTATILLVLAMVPWPFAATAPGMVDFAPLTAVRAASGGFVREIYVEDGERVRAGEPLLLLENRLLEMELQQRRLELAQSEARCRSYQRQHQMAQLEAEQSCRDALEEQVAELQRRVDELTVRAPAGGVVMGRSPDQRLGTFVDVGEEILLIGDPASKEIRFSINQDDVQRFSAGARLSCRIRGVGHIACRVSRVNPRASAEPLHACLCAAYGGPLAVKEREEPQERVTGEHTPWKLVRPRLRGTAELDETTSAQLHAGQRCMVRPVGASPSLGGHLWQQTSEVLRNVWERRDRS